MSRVVITSPVRFAVFIFILLLVAGGVVVYLMSGRTLTQGGEVVIEEGDSAQVVWEKLVTQHFTTTTLPWRVAAWRSGAAQSLQTGTYQLERGEKIAEVVRRMAAGDIVPDELTITYPEGFTLAQMAERTAKQGLVTKDAFVEAAQPEQFVSELPYVRELPADRTLEGYLFPDTYRVFPDDTPAAIIQRLVTNFDGKFSEELRQQAAQKGRTIDQIVIMASILEREVINDNDLAIVSGVLWKRFDEGMGLDADATVRYAVDNWDTPLTVEELAVDSPYNTRRYRGLPPGPISNPGLRALVAAVRPQESEFYYYLSTPEGETIFSKTNDEHNANKAKHL